MQELDFLGSYQRSTPRDYLQRVVACDKAACAERAREFGADYWDGDRQYGYGGYSYDGRWRPIAERIARHYGLRGGQRVLDIGCGKGFLLYELTQAVPGLEIAGLDISDYAVAHAKPEVCESLTVGDCTALPWPDASFDLVLSINTFHNLPLVRLKTAIREMARVSRGAGWLCVESYRNEREKVNLLYWQLTCEAFFRPDDWKALLVESGYRGDCGFIFFE